MDPNPPLGEVYKALMESESEVIATGAAAEECELPLIDLGKLWGGEEWERKKMVTASMEWGFFLVVNHGVSSHLLEKMKDEQLKLFNQPFSNKIKHGCYRWGTPTANSLRQLSWSEAFHIPLHDVTSLSPTMRKFTTTVSELGLRLASILAENLGQGSVFFKENCLPSSCYLRMNRYPPCPNFSNVLGLMPHTDSDFLTILHQDQVGGLQLVKDGRWITVKPNPKTLIINIGDLFQAWSNDVYKSVEHRVVANKKVERSSFAYFVCPSQDATIRSFKDPPIYRNFSYREYRQQVQDDVTTLGHKRGLSQFLA